MLELSRSLNPECEHIQGDMRSLRLGRTFDAVFVHDAIAYMTTEDDLRATIETAAAHVRPGGAVVLTPDTTRELYRPGTTHGGHDGADSRGLRYLQWSHDPDAGGTTYCIDFVVVLREEGKPTRVEYERHVCGIFPGSTWRRLIAEAGLEIVEHGVEDPLRGRARGVRRAPRCLTPSGKGSTLSSTNVCSSHTRDWRPRCSRPLS